MHVKNTHFDAVRVSGCMGI